jgi:hypothetical protein
MRTFACILILSFALSAGVPGAGLGIQPSPIILVVERPLVSRRRRRSHYARTLYAPLLSP